MNPAALDCSSFQACLLRLEQLSNPNVIDLGLERVQKAAQALKLLQPDFTVITVAGTNGKGSTVATLEAIYTAAGYRCGSYTSPHLFTLNERIKINQQSVSDSDFAEALNAVFEIIDSIPLTYFEILTLAAVYLFKKMAMQVVILEVGMGGRLDATNIFDADLAIITTIALDHQEFLGNSIDEIAFEKAGILRKNQWFIYADGNPPSSIIQQAFEKNCKSYFRDKDYSLKKNGEMHQLMAINKQINVDIEGIHPQNTAAAVLGCWLLEEILPLTEQNITDGLKNISICCRRQYIPGDIPHLLDVAHNPQSTALLAETIRQKANGAKVHAVFSCMKDKNYFEMLSPLQDCIQDWYPAQLENDRAVDADIIYRQLKQLKQETQAVQSARNAYRNAVLRAKKNELIVVFGSFYLLGELKEELTSNNNNRIMT